MPPKKRDLITADLRRRIAAGEFPLGSKLPSQSELRTQYDSSQGPIQAAIERLKWEGLIEGHQGKGWFVIRASPSGPDG